MLALFVVPAALFLLGGAAGRRREKVTATVVIALHTFGQLFLGYRSTAIMPATLGTRWQMKNTIGPPVEWPVR